jgi:hypothetical protein
MSLLDKFYSKYALSEYVHWFDSATENCHDQLVMVHKGRQDFSSALEYLIDCRIEEYQGELYFIDNNIGVGVGDVRTACPTHILPFDPVIKGDVDEFASLVEDLLFNMWDADYANCWGVNKEEAGYFGVQVTDTMMDFQGFFSIGRRE